MDIPRMWNWPVLGLGRVPGLSWTIHENQVSSGADVGVYSVEIEFSSALALGPSHPHMLVLFWQLSSFSLSIFWVSKCHQLGRAHHVNGTGSHALIQITVSSHIWVHLSAIRLSQCAFLQHASSCPRCTANISTCHQLGALDSTGNKGSSLDG